MAEGMRLLKKGGIDAVGMREIALRAGVSPRAPYRHFADRTALLAALGEECFRRFAAALRRALETATGKKTRLEVLAFAYIQFAVRYPHFMELMFAHPFPDRARKFPSLQQAGAEAFSVLKDEVIAEFSQADSDVITIAAWSLVHGFAQLLSRRQIENVNPQSRQTAQIISSLVRILERGAR